MRFARPGSRARAARCRCPDHLAVPPGEGMARQKYGAARASGPPRLDMARCLAPGRVLSGREAVERGVDEPRQRLELVAALEHRRDAVAHRPAAARELAEAVLADAHVRERILLVRVEAGGDEEELRLEGRDGGLDDARERLRVLLVAGPRGERHVDRRLRLLVRPSAPGIERPLVERDE